MELEAQRSHPAEFARGLSLMIHDPDHPKALAALRNVAEILIRHANMLTDGKFSR